MEVETEGVSTEQLQRDNVCRRERLMNNEAIQISRALWAWNAGNLVPTNIRTHTDFLGKDSLLAATGHM